MCGRKRAEMENPGIADQIGIYLILCQHHICTWITVERKITVSVRVSMYKSKGSVNFIVHDKISGINAAFFYGSLQLFAEHVVSDLSDKCSFFAKTVQHGKNVTGSSARVCLESRVSLGTVTVFCEVDQKLAESCYIILSVFH